MNKFRLKEADEKGFVYFYQPEGEGEFGEVAYVFDEGSPKIVKKAEDPSACYIRQAFYRMKQFAKEKEFPETYTQAWY